jgi:hypothetical protein
MRYAVLIVWAIVACGRGQSERHLALDAQPGRGLVGTWDTKLSLTRPYPLERDDPAATQICGTIGFVENHYARVSEVSAGVPLHIGVYDLDLSALGLAWLDERVFPTAVISEHRPNDPPSMIAPDTVSILLNPGSPERIVLLGRYDAQGIDGTWTAQSARGTATGLFALRRHDNARDRSPTC